MGITTSVATLEIAALEGAGAFFSLCREIHHRIYVSRVSDVPTGCAGAVRATALVARVEALVAIAFGFALDVIRC